jgi:hypothetical protein
MCQFSTSWSRTYCSSWCSYCLWCLPLIAVPKDSTDVDHSYNSRMSGFELDSNSSHGSDDSTSLYGAIGDGDDSVHVVSMNDMCVLPPGCCKSLTSAPTPIAASLLAASPLLRAKATATAAVRPWLLLWHFQSACLVVVVFWVASITSSTTLKLLQRLDNPVQFYTQFLTDGVAVTDTPCYSPTAPCYCSWSATAGPACSLPHSGCAMSTV